MDLSCRVNLSGRVICDIINQLKIHFSVRSVKRLFGYTVSDVAAVVGGTLVGEGSAEVTCIVKDNREAESGCLFAALPGAARDGHEFIAAAFAAGASCALARYVPEGETRPVILVPDVQAAFQRLASDFRARITVPVLGITGSVGKTTAKEMVASVLSQRGPVLKTAGNYNNHLGVPLTLSRVMPEHRFAVVEMGVSFVGDMAPLAAMARPDAMLFTNIGRAHLEAFGDRAGVLREKGSVLDTMSPDAVAFVNGDDDLLRAMTCRQRKITFGLSEGCDVRAVNAEFLPDGGSRCEIVSGDRRLCVEIRAYGEHMLYAALEGAAVGMYYGLADEEIIAGIEAYAPTGDRSRLESADGFVIVNDCYNANPDSMAAALRTLMRTSAYRRVAILGDMGELGDDAEALHRETGAVAAACGIDLLITCGPLSRHMAEGAREAGLRDVRSYEKLSDVLCDLPDAIEPGDTVLVKASHYMQFEKIVAALKSLHG